MDFMIESTQFDLDLLKLNHIAESAFSIYELEIITESDENESKLKNLIDTIKKIISDIMDRLKEFFGKIKKALTGSITDKDKKIIELANQHIDQVDSEKIDVYSSEEAKKDFDAYLKEVLKLERKLMNMDFDAKLNSPKSVRFSTMREYDTIMKELDELNEKYDKKFLDENAHLIQMAKKDAIRFADKDLDRIGIDYEALEKQSNQILATFKEDANGCRTKDQLNTLQKFSQKVGTRCRMYSQKTSTYKHRSFKGIVLKAAAILIIPQIIIKDGEKIGRAIDNTLSKIPGNEEIHKFEPLAANTKMTINMLFNRLYG